MGPTINRNSSQVDTVAEYGRPTSERVAGEERPTTRSSQGLGRNNFYGSSGGSERLCMNHMSELLPRAEHAAEYQRPTSERVAGEERPARRGSSPSPKAGVEGG